MQYSLHRFASPFLISTYYMRYIARLENAKQIKEVRYDPSKLVYTFWDIGGSDATVIWFVQKSGREYYFIDFYEVSNADMHHYALQLQRLQAENGYVYGAHIAPWDLNTNARGTRKTLRNMASDVGIDFEVLPRMRHQDTIEAVKNILPFCHFDAEKCARGLDGLRNYQKTWNNALRTFMNIPMHNWASHIADAFGTFAMGEEYMQGNSGMTATQEEELYLTYGARV